MPRHPEGQSFGQEMNQEAVGEFTPSRWPLVRIMREMTGGEIPEGENKAEDNKDGGKEKEKAVTIFERFVSSLKNQLEKEKTATIGGTAMTWKEFPLEEALADGLWVIMLKAADRAKHKIGTEKDAEDAAKLINHFLEVGILLQGKSPEEIADEFISDVPAAVKNELEKKSPEETFAANDIWQVPVAKFFAKIIKQVQEAGDEATQIKQKVEKFVSLDKRRGIGLFDVDGGFRAPLDDLRLETAWGNEFRDPNSYIAEYTKYRDAKDKYEACNEFPLKLNTIPEDVYTSNTYVSKQWLWTQLCVAAGDLPDRDYILSTDLPIAAEAIRSMTDEKIIDAFCGRMKKRKPSFTRTAGLDILIKQEVLSYLRLSCGQENIFSIITNFYVKIDFSKFEFSESLARKIVKTPEANGGGNVESIAHAVRYQKDSDRVKILDDIYKAINWSGVAAKEIPAIVSAELLPTDLVVDGILEMPEAEAKKAAQFLVENKKISASAREKLHDKKLLSIDLKELEKNIDGMNREQINSEIINCLNFKAKDNDDEKSIVDILRKLLSLSEAEDLHKLFNNPENRYTLVTKFPQIIFPIEAKSPKTKAGKKFIKEFSKIKELIGDDLCAHWILGDEVVHRLDLSSKNEKEEIIPWTELDKNGLMHKRLTNLGIDVDFIAKALRENTEEEIRSWVYEAKQKKS